MSYVVLLLRIMSNFLKKIVEILHKNFSQIWKKPTLIFKESFKDSMKKLYCIL